MCMVVHPDYDCVTRFRVYSGGSWALISTVPRRKSKKVKEESTMRLTVPTIHSNGTSKKSLLRALDDAGSSINDALDALRAASPHGRDYYPQGSGAIQKATAEHRSRVERLTSVMKELEWLAEKVDDGGHGVSESERSNLSGLLAELRGGGSGGDMTGEEMADEIRSALERLFPGQLVNVSYGAGGLGSSIYIHYANVPRGTKGVAVDNASGHTKILIQSSGIGYEAARKPWDPAPEKVEISPVVAPRGTFRRKKGSPRQIVSALIAAFKKHQEALR